MYTLFHWISEAWSLFIHAWAAVVLTMFLISITFYMVASIVSWLTDPSYRTEIRDRRALKRSQSRSKPLLSRILLRFARFWSGLVVLVNLAVMLECFREVGATDGVLKIWDLYDPFGGSGISTFIVNIVVLSPALLCFWYAEKVETKAQNQKHENIGPIQEG
jgi:hypothetical protein